jgi:hypothetical protein
MSPQHAELAAGRWEKMTFLEQMANIGSEVDRALNWRAKNNSAYSEKAVNRTLELLSLSLKCKYSFSRLKELARVREVLLDFFKADNDFGSSEKLFKNYFFPFGFAVRSKH